MGELSLQDSTPFQVEQQTVSKARQPCHSEIDYHEGMSSLDWLLSPLQFRRP